MNASSSSPSGSSNPSPETTPTLEEGTRSISSSIAAEAARPAAAAAAAKGAAFDEDSAPPPPSASSSSAVRAALRRSLSASAFISSARASGSDAVSTTVTRMPLGPKKTRRASRDASTTSTRNKGPQSNDKPSNPHARSSVSSPTRGLGSNRFKLAPRPNLFMSVPLKMELSRWCRKTPGVSYSTPLPSKARRGITPSVVPGIADAVGRRFAGTPKFPSSRIALSAARMNVLLPTFAAPSTYTSRPLRSANIAPTAFLTPTFLRDDTHATPASVSRRIVTTSWYTQSSNASRSVSFGNRSTLVNTSRMGLPPTTSRTRFKNDPWKSVASTTFTTSAFFSRIEHSCSRSCAGVMRPVCSLAPPWPATAFTIRPCDKSEHRAQSIMPSSCR
mmetsp:Transcript_2892/g.11931  ORF Transcript_2892/g.11931 Transcript_2892/m.11931 type:complete len:389 (+) Transcript_2892:260-1426(+)